MKKYYVCSGDLKRIVLAENPKDAIKIAIEQAGDCNLGIVASVSEQGFELESPDDFIILVPTILKEMHLMTEEDYQLFLDSIDEAHHGLD
jgi:hypothetical protein